MKYLLNSGIFCAALCGILLSGCSSLINSHLQKESMMTEYIGAGNAAVLKTINNKLKEPKWYNSSVVNTGDEIMWRLEGGSMNFNMGNFAESVKQFSIAEKLIAEYDDRALISARDVGAELGMSVTNLNTLPYRGFCRDRIALSIYKSLAYLGMGNESAFRAQINRLRNEQKKVQLDYQKFFEAEKKEFAAFEKKNPQTAQQAKFSNVKEKAEKDRDNDEFTKGMSEVNCVANKGYGYFLNPAAIFLSGLGSIRDENYDNARIDFQRLYEAMPKNPMIQQYYVTVLRAANRKVPRQLKKISPFDFPLDRDCVYVIFASGRSAALKQVAIYFPVMTAWPMCEFYPAPFKNFTVEADNRSYAAEMLADMDGILAQEFKERLPGIITRITLNTLSKEGAYYGGLAALGCSHASAVAICGLAIGGAVYRALLNTADTRSWEILPKEFQLTQFPMPKKRELTIGLGGSRKCQVKIPENCRSAIVFINAPSGRNISSYVFPLQTR